MHLIVVFNFFDLKIFVPSFDEIIVVRPNGQWTTADVKTDVVGDVYGSLSSPPQHLFVVPHWSFLYYNV